MRILAIIAILMLAPTTAMARGGGGGHSPSVHASANVTGIASGKRQHQPIKVVKQWGAASPMLRGQSHMGDRKGGRYLAQ